MPKYTVESPIKFDGRICEVGETVEMDKTLAGPLLDLGRIQSAAKARKAAQVAGEGEDQNPDAADQSGTGADIPDTAAEKSASEG